MEQTMRLSYKLAAAMAATLIAVRPGQTMPPRELLDLAEPPGPYLRTRRTRCTTHRPPAQGTPEANPTPVRPIKTADGPSLRSRRPRGLPEAFCLVLIVRWRPGGSLQGRRLPSPRCPLGSACRHASNRGLRSKSLPTPPKERRDEPTDHHRALDPGPRARVAALRRSG